MDFDVRIWNIVAGLGVVVGCSARPISPADGEAGDSATNGSAEAEETTSGCAGHGCPCVTDDDCTNWYECVDGMCEYVNHLEYGDGGPFDCVEDSDCDNYEICDYYDHACMPLVAPPPACIGKEFVFSPIPTTGTLRLSFVDLDDDDRDELAVATQDELQVYEDLASLPSVTARDPSISITAMTAGHFDAGPGEDLLLLIDDQLQLFSSNGIDGFMSAAPMPAPVSSAAGLLAGDYDGMPPTDLVVWGGSARLITNGGDLEFQPGLIQGAAAFDLGSPLGAIALRHAGRIYVYALDGTVVSTESNAASPYDVVSVRSATGGMRFVTWMHYDGWSRVRYWPASGGPSNGPDAFILGVPIAATSADLDGDGRGDLVYLGDGSRVAIHIDPLGSGCWMEHQSADSPIAAAVGDLDGDGDDEVALQLLDGSVVVVTMM